MIGQFAFSRAGHDRGRLYVVSAEGDDFVYLCDGKGKTPETPKKKNRRHIQPVNGFAEQELVSRLTEGKKVYPEEIRLAIKKFCSGSKKENNHSEL